MDWLPGCRLNPVACCAEAITHWHRADSGCRCLCGHPDVLPAWQTIQAFVLLPRSPSKDSGRHCRCPSLLECAVVTDRVARVRCVLQKSLEDAQGLVVNAQWPGWTCHSLCSHLDMCMPCPALLCLTSLPELPICRSTHLHEPTCECCALPAHSSVSMGGVLQSLRCGFNTRWELLAMQGRIW